MDDDRFKRLYEELLESDTRFRTMADSAPVLLWMAGTDSLCNFFNQQWLVFTGRPMEMEVGTGWAEGVHPEDFQACMDTYLSAFVARQRFRMEYRLRRADGEYRWLLDQGVPRYAPGGAFAGYIGSCVDITELREANEAQRRISRELEVLVKEIHHRVKNNLQLITSLLNLQARHVSDPQAAELFGVTQNRIRSMALLHERLYQSRTLADIGAGDYFTGVVASLRTAIDRTTAATEVSVTPKELVLPIDTAIPCGLILNELVTNAFKYAFPPPAPRMAPMRAPSVKVCMSQLDSGELKLVVADNGVGIPPAHSLPNASTLGLQLVRTLARQLGGELALSTVQGTEWTLTIGRRPREEVEHGA
jgi:PAS domain S-box-containing protein